MDKKCSREESSWLEVEEASPCTGKKADKASIANPRRWSSGANAVAVALIMTIPPILFIFSGHLDAPAVWIKSTVAGLGARGESSKKKDVLLGGLLLSGFDQQSCASRYQSVYYRKNMTRSPTPYLIDRLRRQEALQRRCGPGTDAYRRASDRLKSGQKNVDTVDGCSYLVLLSYRGLGNRILAAASAFLYAMLTDRVLLVDRGKTMGDLFCEPFPGTTWLLPLDFPLQGYKDLGEDAAESYGNVTTLRNETGESSEHRFVYMHLDHAASVENKLAYCDDHRQFLHRVQWVVMRTDGYIAPVLFLNPAYKQELHRMFPRKDSVFYIVSRYLLHPTNDVWGMVTRFYDSYLKGADERLGIQIRVFVKDDKPVQHILDQILACTSQERLLPGVLPSVGGSRSGEALRPPPTTTAGARSKAVLVTGLNGWYHDSIREMYWRSASANGEVVSVHQPSREEHQRMFHRMQDMKALAEMYLLSMTDKIVTSGWSTFGYVGTALGGLTPYIMIKPENEEVPDPPCKRAMSMEPCAQGPPYFECTRKEVDKLLDTGNLVPHVRACEDMSWGLKLTEPISEKDV
ncbi:galactoside 2-alpha-L-fucosyltransferase-like [Triticum dicoccoides]|uniref:galactoside 2-alpha-L-fucosyltransferase-like n=1 Tax=Triticum dicoccoides TaxID=85692 RepID=UPI001890F9EA|nr:galactoside 2-alpha-L-fucosyltransferase-like [Triticum dicoccoides]